MQQYFFFRLVQSVLVVLGVLILVFAMLRLTGDPARLMMPRDASPEDIEAFRKAMGFDRPLIVQFFDFFLGVLKGDFGRSLRYRLPVLPLILERLPATLELATAALLLALLIGVPLGFVGGVRSGTIWDVLARGIGLIGQATPNFWLALLLIYFFAVRLRWFPSFGREGLRSVVLPAVALGLAPMGQFVRLTRSVVLEVITKDYVRTAYSKGLPSSLVYLRHVLPNIAIPLISVLSIQYGYLLSGSIYIETIFSWPGIGRLTADSIGVRDFPVVQAIAIFSSIVVVVLYLLTDLAYALIDPRIRYGNG